MTKWRKGYRRVLAAWLISERQFMEVEDEHVDELILHEAQLIRARKHLARNDDATDDATAAEFNLAPADVHGLRMDLDRTGELEVVDSGF